MLEVPDKRQQGRSSILQRRGTTMEIVGEIFFMAWLLSFAIILSGGCFLAATQSKGESMLITTASPQDSDDPGPSTEPMQSVILPPTEGPILPMPRRTIINVLDRVACEQMLESLTPEQRARMEFGRYLVQSGKLHEHC